MTGSAWSKPSLKKEIRRHPSAVCLFRQAADNYRLYWLCNHTLPNKRYVLIHELDNPVVVLRILIARSSGLQHFECFEAQLYGLHPFVLYSCGQNQRVGFEIIFTLSDAMMQSVSLFVISYHAVQHAHDYRTVRKFQSEEFTFHFSETCFILHSSFHLRLALLLLAQHTQFFQCKPAKA